MSDFEVQIKTLLSTCQNIMMMLKETPIEKIIITKEDLTVKLEDEGGETV